MRPRPRARRRLPRKRPQSQPAPRLWVSRRLTTAGRLAHPRQARPGGALGLSRGAGPGGGCGARGGGRRAARAHILAITSPALTNSSRPRPLSRPRKSVALRLLSVTLPMLSIDVLVLQAAREVSYSARTFTHITSAALAHPRQARPGGALGLSRGAGPGRGCGARGGGRHAARAHLIVITSPALTNSSRPAHSPAARRCAPLRRLSLTPPSLSLLSLTAGQQSSDAARKAEGATTADLAASSAGKAAGGELQRPHNHAIARAASHMASRPGPGEPSGFLVVPGRAEGVAEGEAEGAGLSPSPAPSASRAQPSHILGRPGPGEPSGFLVVPGQAEGVARAALRAVLLTHFARAPARPSSHRLARAHQLLLLALRPLRRAPRRCDPLSLSLSLLPSRSQQVRAPRMRLRGRGSRRLQRGVPRARPHEGRGRRR